MTLSLQNQWGMSAFMCFFTLLHKKQNQIHRTTATLLKRKRNPKNHTTKEPQTEQLVHQTVQLEVIALCLLYDYCSRVRDEEWNTSPIVSGR